MPIDFYGKSGGTWRKVDPAKGLHYKNGSSWQEVDEAYYKSSGSWKKVYQKSDPVLYQFNPTAVDSWRTTGWRGSSNLRIGSYGFGDHWTLMEFMTATDSGTGLTLAEALAIRPAVVDCTLKLARTGGGSSTINSGTYYISWNNGGFGSGTPTNESTYRSTHSLASAGWAQNTDRNFTGLGDLGLKLATNSICIANNLSPVSGGGNDADYTNINSTLSSHILYVRLDYS